MWRLTSFLFLSLCLSKSSAAYADNLTSLSQIKLNNGVKTFTLQLPGVPPFKLRIKRPNVIDSNKKTIIVLALHWSKRDKKTFLRYSKCLPERAFKEFNTYLLTPDWGTSHWMSNNNEQKIVALAQHASSIWPMDSNRIVLTGYSDGGTATWYYLNKYPDLFSAGIVISGSIPNNLDSQFAQPIYVAHSPADELFSFKQVSEISEQLNKNKSITFIKTKRLSHLQACSFKRYQQRAGQWLLNTLKTNDSEVHPSLD